MDFGEILKGERSKAGLGIKVLAPQLGVSYSYLSKLENKQARPSEEFIQRVADYFQYDSVRLFVSADRVPPQVLTLLRKHPDEVVQVLRERFGEADGR